MNGYLSDSGAFGPGHVFPNCHWTAPGPPPGRPTHQPFTARELNTPGPASPPSFLRMLSPSQNPESNLCAPVVQDHNPPLTPSAREASVAVCLRHRATPPLDPGEDGRSRS